MIKERNKNMKKFRLYYDTEKEVKWLNEMSEQGWKLTSFFAGVYTFEECEPGKYLYQEDTTDKLFQVSDEYRNFMSDAGIEIVQVWGPWVILCQEKDKGEFELYTDNESKIAHQKKILRIFKVVAILELICFFIEIYITLNGNNGAIIAAIIIGLFLFVFCKMMFITKARINKLRAENGEISINENGVEIDAETGRARKAYSPALLAGNGLFLISLCMDYEGSVLKENIHTFLLICSCIFMFIGVILTYSGTKEK